MNVSRTRSNPHLALALAAAGVLALEILFRGTFYRVIPEGLIAALALLGAWHFQERLRLPVVLLITAIFYTGLVAIHLTFGSPPADYDSITVYPAEGQLLLDGTYPHSEYPPLAVVLFAIETWLGGGAARTSNALIMLPFLLGLIGAIWALRTRWSSWLASFVALWPMNTYFWEFRFDLVPAALLVCGLALALRERWMLAGFALGLGTGVKWTPALAFAVLAISLLSWRRVHELLRHGGGFFCALALVYLPFLAWNPTNVFAAFTVQGERGITPESMWYVPLHLAGQASVRLRIFTSADIPPWGNTLAITVQLAALVLLLGLAATRVSPAVAVALAALAPAVFLLTNRIFSPQFLVVLAASWVVAASLLVSSRRGQLLAGAAVGAATSLNLLVFPIGRFWFESSSAMFAIALLLTAWLVRSSLVGEHVSGWKASSSRSYSEPATPPEPPSETARDR
jgi:hypothetical protein